MAKLMLQKKMSDTEDPYAVSSDSEDEENFKKPPPKINIEGRESNIKDLVSFLISFFND